MSFLNKEIVLVLNSLWMPIGKTTVRQAIKKLYKTSDGTNMSGRGVALDYNLDENGNPDWANPISYVDVEIDEWINLEVRPFDPWIDGARMKVRAPTIIIAKNYSDIPMRELKPTPTNIFKRDNYTCQYSGRKLPRNKLNLDHVTPKSRGGKNSWNNLVTCAKDLNFKKGDKTPHEAGLRLLSTPRAPKEKPAPFLITEAEHPSWIPFIIVKK